MRKNLWLVLGAVLVLSAALIGLRALNNKEQETKPVSEKPADNTPVTKAADEEEFGPGIGDKKEERERLRKEWLDSMDQVARVTGDEDAKAVAGFVRDNNILAAPHVIREGPEKGLRASKTLEAGRTETWFALIPMMAGDETLGGGWKRFAQGKAGAVYKPDVRCMILPAQEIGGEWKGVTLLHEGFHALQIMAEGYDWTDVRTFCHKERQTHQFQNKIMKKLGGARYDMAVKAEMQQVREKLAKEGKPFWPNYVQRGEYNPLLDDVFGKARSQLDQDMRQTHVWIDAVFRLVDEETKGSVDEKEERKALILKTIYAEGGVLPGMND